MNKSTLFGVIIGLLLILIAFLLWPDKNPVMPALETTSQQQQATTSKPTPVANQDVPKTEIINLNAAVTANYSRESVTELVAKITAYQLQNPDDAVVQSILDNLVNTYGPCVGIPEGQCRE